MIDRRFLIGFTLLFCIALMAGPASAFSGAGSGTQDDPYIIMTAGQLQEMNQAIGAYYQLGANIDLTGVTWTPIGTMSSPFIGTFNGNGHTISNTDNALFAYIDNAEIYAVKVTGARITVTTGGVNIGIIAALCINHGSNLHDIWINDCEITDTAGIHGSFGMILGHATPSQILTPVTISDCYITSCKIVVNSISNDGFKNIAGIANYLPPQSQIKNCYVNGLETSMGNPSQNKWSAGITVCYDQITVRDNVVIGLSMSGVGEMNQIYSRETMSSASNNYATGASASSEASSKNGAQITSAQYNSQSWWQNTAGYDFTNTWYWDSTDNLPKLQVFNQMVRITSLTVPAYTHAQNPNTLTATVELVNQSIVPTYLWEYSSDGTAWNTIGSTQTISWTPELNPGEYQVRLTVSANGRATSASTSTLVYVTPEAVPDYAGNVSTSTTDTYGAQSAWTLPGTQTAGVFQDISKYVLTANNGIYEIDSVYQTVSPFSDYAFGTITDAYISAQKVATVATGFAFVYDANGNPTRMKNSALGTPARIAVANTTAAVSDGTHVVIFGTDGTFKRSITQTVTQLAANSETDVIVGHNAGTTLYIWYGASGTTSQTFPQAITEIHEILGSNSFIVGTAANTYVLSISAGGAKSLVVTSTDNLPLRHLDGTQTYTVAGANAAGLYIFDSTGTTIGTYTEGSTIQANAIARVSGLVTLSGGLDQQAYFFDKSGSSSWTLAQSTAIGAPISAVSLSTDAGYAVVVTQTNKIYLFKRQLTPGQTTSSYYLNGVIMKSSGEKYIGPFSWNGNQLYTDSEGVFTVPVLPGTVYTLICGDSRQQYTATNVGSQSHVFKLSGQTLQSSITYSAAYNAETHAIEMNYQDTSSKTTAVQWRIVNKNDDIVYLTNTTAGQTVSYQVPINETADNFIVTVSANRDNMKVQNTWNVNPQGTAPINLYGLDETGRNIIFCFILMILGGLFGVMHSTKGAVIVSFVAVWMRYVEFITVPWICVIIAAVISIIASIGWGGQDKV